MVKTIIEQELLPKSSIHEEAIGSLIQLREYQILIANDWNLAIKSANDFVEMLLKGENPRVLEEAQNLV
jgi:hypothetical protein